MKQQLLLIFLCFFSICSFSQETSKIDYDTKAIEGTWIATSGNKSYEVTFVKESIFHKPTKHSIELILGSMKYVENNKTLKMANIDGEESPLILLSRNTNKEFTVYYKENDNGKRIFGRVYFDISVDGKTARWYNLSETNGWGNKPKKDKFDIPKELTFKKK